MASIQLVVEQVNHEADDMRPHPSVPDHSSRTMRNAFSAVVDANTDFIKSTPVVNDGLSDTEDINDEDRPSSTETITEADKPDNLSDTESQYKIQKSDQQIPSVHERGHRSYRHEVFENHPTSFEVGVSNNDEGISDMTYPQISYPVAQYLFEANPGLTEKMERILVSRSSSQGSTPLASVEASPLHKQKSSLLSLTSTTDALALRQSVIGHSGIPAASPDQVAQAINKIQADRKKAKQLSREVCTSKMETRQVADPGEISKDNLVPYRANTLTKVVEKVSWFGTSSEHENNSAYDVKDTGRIHSRSGAASSTKQDRRTDNSVDSGYSPKSDKLSGDRNRIDGDEFLVDGIDREFQLGDGNKFGDMFETASNYSERLETMSNVSGISGFEEEMFRIKKLLIEVPCSPTDLQALPRRIGKADRKCEIDNSKVERKCVERDSVEENNRLFDVQRENANLEGQVEVLRGEIETAVEERAKMQATLASLQTQLKSQITSTQNTLQEKEMAESELEKIVKSNKNWNSYVVELQGSFEKQSVDVKSLKDELNETEDEKSRLKVAVEEIRMDLEMRDGAVDGLKRKIAELHVELQTMMQSKIRIHNDYKSVQSEVESLQKSKSWYQQQLHSVQEERGQIQQDLMVAQSQAIAVNSELAQSKSQVVNLKQQLTEVKHHAVREKELLMRHLETIEADMVEREVVLEQLQKNRNEVDVGLATKLRKVEEEKSKLNNITFKASDLERQLEIVKSDMSNKQSSLECVEKEKVDLMKRLTLAERSIADKNFSIQSFDNKLSEVNMKVKQLQQELTSRDERTTRLQSDKVSLELSLASANDEKREITDALSSLKSNMTKVESNFKLMKSELVKKTSSLEQVQRENERLATSVHHSEQTMASQRQEFESQVCMDSQQRGLIVGDLKRQKSELEKVVVSLRIELHNSQIDLAKLTRKHSKLEEKMQDMEMRWDKMQQRIQKLTEEKQFLQVRLERQTFVRAPSIESEDIYKSRAKELQRMLNVNDADHLEKQRVYKSNVKVLMRKLRQLREKAEEEMNLRIASEKREILNGDLGDTEELRVVNDRLSNEIGECKTKVETLESQLADTKRKYEKEKRIAEKNHKLALDLEKEKGKLAGVTQTHSALKQHTSHLEATLAQHESVVSELDYQSREACEKQRFDEARLHEKILGLEEALGHEKNTVKEVRKQLFQDKRENSSYKRHLQSMKESLGLTNQHVDAKKMEIIKLRSELDVKIQAELKHRAEIEAMHTELKKSVANSDRLSKELNESQARDPVLNQQMKTLTWHLKQKNDELSGVKEQLKMVESTHDNETKALQTSTQRSEEAAKELRDELSLIRKEKFSHQGKLSELRTALKSSIDKNKELSKELNEIRKSSRDSSLPGNLNLPDSPTPYDESYINELLEKSAITVPQTRPLNNLKTCLHALKQEVDELQKQLHVDDGHQGSTVNSRDEIYSSENHVKTNGIQTL